MNALRVNFLLLPLFCLLTFGYGIFVSFCSSRWVDFSVLENYNPGKPSVLLDDEGVEWARFEIDRRKLVRLSEVPQHLINALLASEDREFFNHIGISWRGILRSTLVNLKNRRVIQGASTITQQLVKLLFFDSRRTFRRKIKEQFVSLLVERQFTKEQILETYLNHVYFGCGIYGVEAAARRFFGKSACDLDLAEAATLACVVKNPGQYCPLISPESAQKRRNIILHQVAGQNLISIDEYQKLAATPVTISDADEQNLAPHLKEAIRKFLEEQFGKYHLYNGGLVIQTTINSKIQRVAQDEFKKKFNELKKSLGKTADGALISMHPKTGEIKALIGGCDFKKSKFDRALQARRQMGSIFKPIVYAAAVQAGYNFAHVEVDEPLEIKSGSSAWQPRNSTRTFEGPITLAKALSFSNNIVTVKALMRAGINNVIDFARKCGLNPPDYPSISLGCLDVTLKEAIGAFNVFANGGVYVRPHYLRWIKDEWGAKIWQNEEFSRRAIPSKVTSQVTKVLGIGPQRFLKRLNRRKLISEAIGKTGTTNDSRTCWFAGAVPDLTTVLYLGRDNNKSLGYGIYPVWTLFPIWISIQEKVIQDAKKFVYDSSLRSSHINWVTGREVRYNNDNTVDILV